MSDVGEKISGVKRSRVWNANAGLVVELRNKIVDVLGLCAVGVKSKDLENKSWWIENDKRHVLVFFDLERREKGVIGVDERLAGDIMESDS